jgi:hypothetical protein
LLVVPFKQTSVPELSVKTQETRAYILASYLSCHSIGGSPTQGGLTWLARTESRGGLSHLNVTTHQCVDPAFRCSAPPSGAQSCTASAWTDGLMLAIFGCDLTRHQLWHMLWLHYAALSLEINARFMSTVQRLRRGCILHHLVVEDSVELLRMSEFTVSWDLPRKGAWKPTTAHSGCCCSLVTW